MTIVKNNNFSPNISPPKTNKMAVFYIKEPKKKPFDISLPVVSGSQPFKKRKCSGVQQRFLLIGYRIVCLFFFFFFGLFKKKLHPSS